jgi:hypothetical protein
MQPSTVFLPKLASKTGIPMRPDVHIIILLYRSNCCCPAPRSTWPSAAEKECQTTRLGSKSVVDRGRNREGTVDLRVGVRALTADGLGRL